MIHLLALSRATALEVIKFNISGIASYYSSIENSHEAGKWNEILNIWWMLGGEKEFFIDAVSEGKEKKKFESKENDVFSDYLSASNNILYVLDKQKSITEVINTELPCPGTNDRFEIEKAINSIKDRDIDTFDRLVEKNEKIRSDNYMDSDRQKDAILDRQDIATQKEEYGDRTSIWGKVLEAIGFSKRMN